MNNQGTQQLVDHLFRHESGKMIAVLTRVFGAHNLGMAEDVVQESFMKAIQLWKFEIPDNPSGWLMQVAKNKAIDIIRRQQNFNHLSKEVVHQLQQETENTIDQFFHDSEIPDSQLRLIFTCCHPTLKPEDQIALTLKTVSGFGVKEIAKALMTNDEAIQKRLYRAKEFIRYNNIQFEIPAGRELLKRVETVQAVVYLIFNEGYNSMKKEELIRYDLCAEAMRLCKLLTEHSTVAAGSNSALLALMCFHAARFESRMDDNHSIVLLPKQDRSKWNRDLIKMGSYYLNNSSIGDSLSVYHIESAIAAEHCIADSFDKTNWQRLLNLYDLLYQMKPSPVVALNRAVVLSEMGRIAEAIESATSIQNLEALLQSQYIYGAVLGDLCIRLNESEKATDYLLQALSLTTSEAEKRLIMEKLKSLAPSA